MMPALIDLVVPQHADLILWKNVDDYLAAKQKLPNVVSLTRGARKMYGAKDLPKAVSQ